jgi:hypothetical protein
MQRTCFLVATVLTPLLPVMALAVAVQSNLPIKVAAGQSGGSTVTADRNASKNWQMAGMLSVGRIPVRKTACATIRLKAAARMTQSRSIMPSGIARTGMSFRSELVRLRSAKAI